MLQTFDGGIQRMITEAGLHIHNQDLNKPHQKPTSCLFTRISPLSLSFVSLFLLSSCPQNHIYLTVFMPSLVRQRFYKVNDYSDRSQAEPLKFTRNELFVALIHELFILAIKI